MPCNVDFDPTPFEAMLCGITMALHKQNCLQQFLGKVDWVEAGVSRHVFEEWWRLHQRRDTERKAQEAAERRRAELREAARAKLSPAERAALGL